MLDFLIATLMLIGVLGKICFTGSFLLTLLIPAPSETFLLRRTTIMTSVVYNRATIHGLVGTNEHTKVLPIDPLFNRMQWPEACL